MQAIIDWLGGLQLGNAPYCFWLLLAAALFAHALEKRRGWGLRAAVCAAGFIALGWAFPSAKVDAHMPLVVLWYVAAWLLVSLICWCVCRVSLKEAFFVGINAVLLEHIGSSLQILITVWLAKGNLSKMTGYGLLAYAAVYAAGWLLIGRKMVRGAHPRVNAMSVATITVSGLTVTVILSMLFKSNIDPDLVFVLTDPHAIALVETGQLYAIFFCVSILVLEYVQQQELLANERLAASHEMWTVRQKQYEMSRETIDTINRKCHDMKHQIAALMAQGADSGEARRYGEEVERLIEIYDLQVRTANEALNTILMEKGLYCSTHDIRWNCAVDDSTLDFIDRMDLYVLLGNALDNAIEAVERIEDGSRRIIQLQISRKGGFVCIRLENSFDGSLHWQDGLPATTKADKSSHGIGLKSIRAIARKYGGDVTTSVEGQAFILSVIMPLSGERA